MRRILSEIRGSMMEKFFKFHNNFIIEYKQNYFKLYMSIDRSLRTHMSQQIPPPKHKNKIASTI